MNTTRSGVGPEGGLKPRYDDWFPEFDLETLAERIAELPLHLATQLTGKNLRLASRITGRDEVREFSRRGLGRQREELIDVLTAANLPPNIVHGIGRVKRERFLPARLRPLAYLNQALHLTPGRCLTPPGLVGLMLDRLRLDGGCSVLELGSGSGYHLACVVMSTDAEVTVAGIEEHAGLARFSRAMLAGLGSPANIRVGDALRPKDTPGSWDRVYVTFSPDPGRLCPATSYVRNGGILQYARMLSPAEFEVATSGAPPGRVPVEYEEYRMNWRRYGCLVSATDGCEVDRLYGVQFVADRFAPQWQREG